MAGILDIKTPGTSIEGSSRDQILSQVRRLCHWQQNTFPGSQPVSLSRTNLQDLNRKPYVACEKTDGVRFLLYAASNRVFLVDRLETVHRLNFFLPRRFDKKQSHQNTLLDGELVKDLKPNGEFTLRYLIYDAVTIHRQDISALNLLDRLKMVYLQVIQPRLEFEKTDTGLDLKTEEDFIDLYLKDFFEIWDIPAIWNLKDRLPHLCDGIIFTPVCVQYVPGSCKSLMKWKPPHLNTVDFKAEVLMKQKKSGGSLNGDSEIAVRLFVATQGMPVFRNHWLALKGKAWDEIRTGNPEAYNHQIWECYYDFEAATLIPTVTIENGIETFDMTKMELSSGGWCLERVRIDKSTPNDERVVEKVFESIRDGVDFEELVSTFYKFQQNGKQTVAQRCTLPGYYEKFGSKMFVKDATEDLEPKKRKIDV